MRRPRRSPRSGNCCAWLKTPLGIDGWAEDRLAGRRARPRRDGHRDLLPAAPPGPLEARCHAEYPPGAAPRSSRAPGGGSRAEGLALSARRRAVSLEQMAKITHRDPSTLSRFERGLSAPRDLDAVVAA